MSPRCPAASVIAPTAKRSTKERHPATRHERNTRNTRGREAPRDKQTNRGQRGSGGAGPTNAPPRTRRCRPRSPGRRAGQNRVSIDERDPRVRLPHRSGPLATRGSRHAAEASAGAAPPPGAVHADSGHTCPRLAPSTTVDASNLRCFVTAACPTSADGDARGRSRGAPARGGTHPPSRQGCADTGPEAELLRLDARGRAGGGRAGPGPRRRARAWARAWARRPSWAARGTQRDRGRCSCRS